MASREEVIAALLQAIHDAARNGLSTRANEYAEALAWVTAPAQPHGGGSASS